MQNKPGCILNMMIFQALNSLSCLPLHYVTEIENAFKSNEGLLLDYEAVIRRMEENMMEYNEYILQRTEFYAVCQSGRR